MCLMTAVWMVFGTAGCSDESIVSETVVPGTSEFYLNLTLRMGDGVRTRTAAPDLPEHPATDAENRIRSLHLFFERQDGTRTHLRVDADLTAREQTTVRVRLEEPLAEGVTIYLGANLDKT